MAYNISLSTRFKKQYKKCMRQGLPEEEIDDKNISSCADKICNLRSPKAKKKNNYN